MSGILIFLVGAICGGVVAFFTFCLFAGARPGNDKSIEK